MVVGGGGGHGRRRLCRLPGKKCTRDLQEESDDEEESEAKNVTVEEMEEWKAFALHRKSSPPCVLDSLLPTATHSRTAFEHCVAIPVKVVSRS